jgi:hypothetical protein
LDARSSSGLRRAPLAALDRAERARDRLGHLGLDRQQILERAVVAIAPFGDVRWRGAALERQRYEGEARPRHCLDPVVPPQLLQPLFKRLGDEILHLLRGRAWPCGSDGQHLHREGRIFGAAELDEGISSCGRDREDEKESDRALPYGQRGEIEAAHCKAMASLATRTCAPGLRRCAPSATIRSPGLTPLTTAVSSASLRTSTGRNETVDAAASRTHKPVDLPSS